MSKHHKQVSAFSLEGRFLGFEVEDGYKIKRLNLATADGELCLKLSKESRASVQGVLTPGDWISVFGEKILDRETGELKYKASLIRQALPGQQSLPDHQAPSQPIVSPKLSKKTILYCQKSDCMKRGGKALCQALQATLRDRGLDDQVTLKGTGCMKECKAGPNLVVMPGKARYSSLSPQAIPGLIDRHFPTGHATQTTSA